MDKTDFVSIFVLLMLTIMLPEIITRDKVVYYNEHEGVVTNIESPLGYQQFTVKLLNGLTRICARYQIAKIDNYFSENGPTDDEWMDIISASLLPEGRPLSSVSEPTVGDWDAMNNEVTDDAVGALPSDEDWHAIDIALSEPLAMCPNQETLTSAPTPVSTATKSISSAGQEHGTNVTLAPSTSSRRKKTVSFADPISSFIVAQTTRGSKASTPRTRAGRVALDIMTVQHDEPQPHTSGTGQRFTEPHTIPVGQGRDLLSQGPIPAEQGRDLLSHIPIPVGQGRDLLSHGPIPAEQGRDLLSHGPVPAGQGRDLLSHSPIPAGQGRDLLSHGPVPAGQGRDLLSHGPVPAGQGRDLLSHGPVPAGQGRDLLSHSPIPAGQGRDLLSHGPVPAGQGRDLLSHSPVPAGQGRDLLSHSPVPAGQGRDLLSHSPVPAGQGRDLLSHSPVPAGQGRDLLSHSPVQAGQGRDLLMCPVLMWQISYWTMKIVIQHLKPKAM